MKPYIFLIFFLLTFKFGYSQQKKYPQDYFDAPLKIPIVLSGTFGELRNNHFHSGVDIKTQGKEGIPVYAPADGYVSRIKVAQYGFGKALYINHPNGYKTVYAHLKKYAPKIQEYVNGIQYRKESYHTGNIFPKPDEFPVKKGEIIAYCGNSGSSMGPHLHYEIRDTATDHIINPMLFGLLPTDTKRPTLKKLMAFPLDDFSRINQSARETIIPFKNIGDGKHLADRITANGYIGFGISAFDRLDGASNKNGLYSLEMKVDGKRVYYHDVETFSFPESKYINLLIDYRHYAKYKSRLQKTHRVESNKLSIYKDLVNDGKLLIEENYNYIVEILAKDFKGNTSTLTIPIKGVKNNTVFTEKDTTAYKITTNEFAKFTQKNVTVAFPKNTFYKDIFLDFVVEDSIAKIHEPTVPLNKRFTLTFNTDSLSDIEKQRVYIANVTKKKYPRYVSTKKKDSKVYTTSKVLGSYALKYDSIKPTIKLLNFKDKRWISALNFLKIKIKDRESGLKNWRATIDDEWVLLEFNHKKGILTYDFSDKKLIGSKHIFKLIVTDNVGNTETISATFFKKQQ